MCICNFFLSQENYSELKFVHKWIYCFLPNVAKVIGNSGRGVCLGMFQIYEKRKNPFAQKAYVSHRVFIRFTQAVKEIMFSAPRNPTDASSWSCRAALISAPSPFSWVCQHSVSGWLVQPLDFSPKQNSPSSAPLFLFPHLLFFAKQFLLLMKNGCP